MGASIAHAGEPQAGFTVHARLVHKGLGALAGNPRPLRKSCKTADLISSYEKQSARLGVSMVVAQVVCPSPGIYGMG